MKEQKTDHLLTDNLLEEALITAWVKLTGSLKNTRITQGMNYNEATIMLIVYNRYRADGEGLVSFKELVRGTKMLKSLVNRTIDSLVRKNLLKRLDGTDKRTTFVRLVEENLNEFLLVHKQSLLLAERILNLIGEEDARTFVRIVEKITNADPLADSE